MLKMKKLICMFAKKIAKIHYIAKIIGSPPSNERFDYFSNLHEYKS